MASSIEEIHEELEDMQRDWSEMMDGPIEALQDIQQSLKTLNVSSNVGIVPLLYYRPEHFIIEELVDPKTFQDRGQRAFDLLDPCMLWTLDHLRKVYGSITINNWKWGGQYQYSGFRPKHCSTGATYSQHRCGRGFDLKFKDHTPQKIRQDIRDNPDKEEFKYITCVENKTATWVHIDSRPIKDRIMWVNP